ncbi:MAG TPA: ATP-binding protein [Candidatus Limnocylindria bacterium]|nr:ATP-binding protein [Candidatus Limnocylindria bacterium]
MDKRPNVPLVASAKSVKLERERLNSLINSMGDGVIAVDENLKVAVSNGAALNILDVNTSLQGKSITDVLHLVNKNNQSLELRQLISGITTSHASREWKLRYPDGETVNLYTSIAPVRLGYGQRGQKGYVILLRDITREKSLEEERDEFISVVSHELRTPITIAEGNLSNARFIFDRSGLKNIPVQEALEQAHTQINFLSAMINDLSMLSRAERGKLTVDIESINVHDLVKELAKNYQKQVVSKGLKLQEETDPSLELLQSSRLYVREILQNLITNALKYTEKGHVTIGAKAKKAGVEFYVADTGMGISKSDQEKIFDKFFRAENFQTRETSGTGLGLYVTMKLARLLHAEITVDSELGKGSTFTIFIPNLQ